MKTQLYTYIFFREEGFYTIELRDDIDAIASVLQNDGTIKVESVNGRPIWPDEKHKYALAVEDVDFITKGRAYLVTEEDSAGLYVIDDEEKESWHIKASFKFPQQ